MVLICISLMTKDTEYLHMFIDHLYISLEGSAKIFVYYLIRLFVFLVEM